MLTRPRTGRWRRWWPLAAGLAIMVLLCLIPAGAEAQRQRVSVQIDFGADGTDVWSPTLSSPDVVAKPYRIASVSSTTPRTRTVTGYSLEAFLTAWEQHENVSPDQFSLVEIPGETGTVLLSEAEAMSNPSTTPRVPVFWTDREGNIGFADDQAQDSLGEVDQVRLYTGQELAVAITATRHEIPDNTDVRFTTSVSPAGGRLRYDWIVVGNAEDNRATSGPTYRAPFSVQGSYRAYVIVTDPANGSVGVSRQIAITVGPPATQATARRDHAIGKHRHAKTSGAATKRSAGIRRRSTTTTTDRGRQPAGTRGKVRHVVKHTSDAPTPHRKPTATTRHTRTPTKRHAADPLSGIVVANPSHAGTARSAPGSTPQVEEAAQPIPAVKTVVRHGLHLSEGAWIVVGVLSALGAGVLLESGTLRRRLRPPVSLRAAWRR